MLNLNAQTQTRGAYMQQVLDYWTLVLKVEHDGKTSSELELDFQPLCNISTTCTYKARQILAKEKGRRIR